MAFFKPKFNLWAKVYRHSIPAGPSNYGLLGYTQCQLRGPDGRWDGRIETGSNGTQFELLFPAGTDIRPAFACTQNIWPDIVFIAGFGNRFCYVYGCCPKGAGFPNEYLLCVAAFWPAGANFSNVTTPQAFGIGRPNPDLQPPDGYTPVPLMSVASTWPLVSGH